MRVYKREIQEIFKLFGDPNYGLKFNDNYIDFIEYEFLANSKDKLFIISIYNNGNKRLDYFRYNGPQPDEYQWLNCYDVDKFYEIKQILNEIINLHANIND